MIGVSRGPAMRCTTTLLLGVTLLQLVGPIGGNLRAGVGIADATGPIAEITFMGYGKFNQKGTGLHLRQFSRAFIFETEESRLVLVVIDAGMMGDGVRLMVLKILKKLYGNLYNEDNVMLSGTHTHSAPGGFLFHILFDIPSLGFSRETFSALVTAIVKSIVQAHNNLQAARLELSKGELLGANINRSPTAYELNPHEERAKYKYNVDRTMVQLKIKSATSNEPIGAVTWFAVHPTSMNNTNTLVSSDNVGAAAILFEQQMNPNGTLGKGPFVAAFASTNLGDASPNIGGPKCLETGESCDREHSTCSKKGDVCIASGPGHDMFESTRIIAEMLHKKAQELWADDQGREIKGSLKSVHQYVDMATAQILVKDPVTSQPKLAHGCLPAMGYSFAAGTTDGPGAFSFIQGTTSSNNPLWNALRDFLAAPTKEDIECHAPKPILLASGRMTFPFDWQPRIVSTQLALFGDLAFACVPGEFTTMSGRRLRKTIGDTMQAMGLGRGEVIVVGLCNTYSDYIATPEEYQVQRYEGASTVYGPHTLDIYLSQFANLTEALIKGESVPRGPEPVGLEKKMISFITPVIFDVPRWGHDFGNVLVQPPSFASPGETVSARFVAGNPRNYKRHGDTLLVIERKVSDDKWSEIATDVNWETKYHWVRVSDILGTSEAIIEWTIPMNTPHGTYRIRHLGTYRYILGGLYAYEGKTRPIESTNPKCGSKRNKYGAVYCHFDGVSRNFPRIGYNLPSLCHKQKKCSGSE